MRRLRLGSLLLSAVLAACAAGNAVASTSHAVSAGEAKVRLLVSGKTDTNSAPVFRGGIEIALSPGWKTYWRYPGDAGIPPRFDWSGSENVAKVEVLYPAPKRISDGSGQQSIGYEDHVIFPLRITAQDAAKPFRLKLKLDFATCEKLCIPAQANVTLTSSPDTSAEPLLEEAERRVPKLQNATAALPLAIVSAKFVRGNAADGSDGRILIEVRSDATARPELFAEGPGEEWTLSIPGILRSAADRTFFSIPLRGSRLGSNDAPPRIRLTLVAGKEAIETEIPLD